MKLWILTFALDDDHFVGTFSTEEKAQAASAAFSKDAEQATMWISIVPVELDNDDLVDIELCGTGD
jgi:hypothetical protein